MMTERQRIAWLLALQEHPERLTDEQLQQMLADGEMRRLVQQLAFAKRAFKHDELNDNAPDVDSEWEKFAASHAEALDALDDRERKPRFALRLPTHKIAASVVGVLLASGIAFAAIQVVQSFSTPGPQRPTTEQTADAGPAATLPADTAKANATAAEPYTFDNVPLDSMLTAIAAAHGAGVEFEDEAARGLRFHFVWKREDSLDRVIEKLNTFEAVNIGMEGEKLVVR